MKIKYIVKVVFTIFLAILVNNCAYNEDVIEELSLAREFAPVDLTARVRNQTNVELNWDTNDNADHYVVEFSADDPNFTTIFLTEIVSASELPVLIRLEGETLYSIRVKAVSDRGLGDSSWAITEAQTLSEQIMLPFELCDVQALEATLRWEAGLNVTHFILQPGDIRHDITAQEKADGVAVVTGLTGETAYSVILYNNTKIRGTASFTTEVDPSVGTIISATDDLLSAITNAASGDILLLEGGDYTAQIGSITLDKSITIRGLLSCDRPLLGNNFELIGGATDVSLINLDLNGMTTVQDVVRYTGSGNFNSLLVKDCNIHDFDRSFIAGNQTDAIVQSVSVENCVVTNVITNGGDFIDFRNSDALNLNILKSTFNNCAPGRDFIRLDNAGTSNGNTTINVLLESCTLYGCSDNGSRRIFYVRFESNEIVAKNNLITDTDAEGFSDQSRTDENIEFLNNNYFNAPTLYTPDPANPNNFRYDQSGTYTTLDPGYVDAANGNFTVTNQTLLDNAVGDPRWLQ